MDPAALPVNNSIDLNNARTVSCVRNRNRRTSAEVRKADKSPMLRAMRYYHRRELHTDYLLINTGMATMFQHQHRFSPCA